jgi:uncharacterized membrane protein
MAFHCYLDESFEGSYVIAVAIIPAALVAPSRATLRALRAPGARRFHTASERPERRALALFALSSVPAVHGIAEVAADVPRHERRSAALSAAIAFAVGRGVSRVVIERADAVDRQDRRAIFDALTRLEARGRVTYEFLRAYEEPLLWIPDVVAWHWARGGATRAKLGPLVIERIPT